MYGVEPFDNVIEASVHYAAVRKIDNVEFRRCSNVEIPLVNESVDVVLSYDVLEHVKDPRCSVNELYRVLRPGGLAFLVFPVYFGALSHHLDYVSIVPGLHWFFSARTLVQAVNIILRNGGSNRFGTAEQPEPVLSFDGARPVLPLLNGLGGEHLASLFSRFELVQLHRHGLFRRRRPQSLAMRLLSVAPVPTLVQDMLTSSVSAVLRKPGLVKSPRM